MSPIRILMERRCGLQSRVAEMDVLLSDERYKGRNPIKWVIDRIGNEIEDAKASSEKERCLRQIREIDDKLASACDDALNRADAFSDELAAAVARQVVGRKLMARLAVVAIECREASSSEMWDAVGQNALTAMMSSDDTKSAKQSVAELSREMEQVDPELASLVSRDLREIDPRGDFVDILTIGGLFTSLDNMEKLDKIAEALESAVPKIEADYVIPSRQEAWELRIEAAGDDPKLAEVAEVASAIIGVREPTLAPSI